MKNFQVIEKALLCNENTYRVMRFTAETDAELNFGSNPWIAVHESFTEKDFPLTGAQMLISKTYEELETRIKLDAAVRNFKTNNPDFTTEELVKFMMTV